MGGSSGETSRQECDRCQVAIGRMLVCASCCATAERRRVQAVESCVDGQNAWERRSPINSKSYCLKLKAKGCKLNPPPLLISHLKSHRQN
jgi:hypothetical protein